MAKRGQPARPIRPQGRRTTRPVKGASAVPGAPPDRPQVPPGGPPGEAVALFEEAMAAMQRHSYADAAERFRAVLNGSLAAGPLADRSRVYLNLCERELQRQPAPRTVEERLTAATAALNDGDDATAERLTLSVLRDQPDQDLALYLLAAVEARRGQPDAALDLLGQAMAIAPEIRAQARHDSDFETLRDLDAFRDLLAEAPVSGRRGPRRGRSER